MTVNIIFNKNEETVEEGITISRLLEEKELKRVSVWVNGKQLLLAEYPSYEVKEGDLIKTLRVIAGG